jgi:hypothetical protein
MIRSCLTSTLCLVALDVFSEPPRSDKAIALPISTELLIANGKCGERSFLGIIDTGTLNSVITPGSNELYGTFWKSTSMGGANGSRVGVSVHQGVPLFVGDHALALAPVIVGDLTAVSTAIGLNVEAIIGVRQMRLLRLSIDRTKGFVSLGDDPPKDLPSWNLAKMEEPLDGVNVRLPFNGKEVRFLVDTGSNGCIEIQDDLFDQMVRDGMIAPSGVNTSKDMFGGSNNEQTGRFTKGELMGLNLTGLPVNKFSDRNLIGMQLLFHFDCRFDFPEMAFRFRSRPTTPNAIPLGPFIGAVLSFNYKGHEAVVEELGKDGAFEKAGIVEGDRIIKFGSIEGKLMNLISLADYVQTIKPGELPVTIRKKGSDNSKDIKVTIHEIPRTRIDDLKVKSASTN